MLATADKRKNQDRFGGRAVVQERVDRLWWLGRYVSPLGVAEAARVLEVVANRRPLWVGVNATCYQGSAGADPLQHFNTASLHPLSTLLSALLSLLTSALTSPAVASFTR